MTAIHFILNLAGLLLWLKWVGFGGVPSPGAGIGNRFPGHASPAQERLLRLIWLIALALLLAGRGLIYWQMGSAANWTPTVSLGAIHLTFRSDLLSRVLLFSVVGFLQTLGQFYLFLLLVSAAVPRGVRETPVLQLIRQHLRRIDRWPAWIKLLVPIPVMAALWVGFTPLLSRINLLVPPDSMVMTALQGLVLGISACLFWAYAAATVLLLYLLNSYIYFGPHPFWAFIQEFGGRLVDPLAALPLRLRKADFAPVVGIGLMWCLMRYIPPLLTAAFRRLQ
jgi:hypothetical protein